MAMSWWIWILFGFVLLALEMATGGFFLMFFGAGAIVVGALAGAGLIGGAWAEWALFTAVSVGLLAVLRKPLRERMTAAAPPVDAVVGETAIAIEPIAVGATGKAELRGTSWMAHNAGTAEIVSGQRCRVERVDGLTLWLTAEGA